MLRAAIFAIAGISTVGGIVLAFWSGVTRVIGIELVAFGVLLAIGTAFERWRYRPPVRPGDDGRWQRTQERFVDPESGEVLTVYYDPTTGQRDYRRV